MGCQSSKAVNRVSPVLDSDAALTRSRYSTGESGKEYVTFVSHYKMEAATDARLLQMELEKIFRRKVFLDSDDLKDLSQLALHVTKDSDCLLLVQSAGVLTRPYCLLELYHAIEANVPIIGVNLRGQFRYDFAEQESFLLHLDTALEEVNPGASEVLKEHGVDIKDVAFKLSSRVPKIISIEFNSCASRNIITATFNDIAENVRRSLASDYTCPKLHSKEDWLRDRESKPWLGAGRRGSQPNASTQHGTAVEPRISARASLKMAAGSAILQLAKSPVPGLAPVAFMLQAVTTAAARAIHQKEDCEMFGCICEHIEQVLIEHGDKLRRHPQRADLIKSITELLSKGLSHMKPLASADFDDSTLDYEVFPLLCGELHDVASKLEADVELLTPRKPPAAGSSLPSSSSAPAPVQKSDDPAFTGAVFKTQGVEGGGDAEAEAAAKAKQDETIAQMRSMLEKQQLATELETEQKRVMEVQNRLLEDRVKEMNAMLGQLKAEEFQGMFPLPADEADRILTVEDYGLFKLPMPFRPIEEIVAGVAGDKVLGDDLHMIFISILDANQQKVVCAYVKHDDGEFKSFVDGMTEGFAESAGAEHGVAIPRKFTACQYVVATGQLVCARRDGKRDMDEKVMAAEKKMPYVESLMAVDPGFQAGGFSLLAAPDAIPQERERTFFQLMGKGLSSDTAMYAGAPIRIDGHTVGAFCATFLPPPAAPGATDEDRDVNAQQMGRLHTAAEEVSAAFVARRRESEAVAGGALEGGASPAPVAAETETETETETTPVIEIGAEAAAVEAAAAAGEEELRQAEEPEQPPSGA